MEIKCRVSGLNENESRAAAVADSTGIFYETGKLIKNRGTLNIEENSFQ